MKSPTNELVGAVKREALEVRSGMAGGTEKESYGELQLETIACWKDQQEAFVDAFSYLCVVEEEKDSLPGCALPLFTGSSCGNSGINRAGSPVLGVCLLRSWTGQGLSLCLWVSTSERLFSCK